LAADAKKALQVGFGGATGAGPAGGAAYLPYLDFKKSPLFGNCYNYAAPHQLPPHLPFMPFGYHGMMNLAVAGNHLQAAMQRRGDDLQQRLAAATGRTNVAINVATDNVRPSSRRLVLAN